MVLTPASPAPCVLLRGLTREAGHWGRFEPLLREAVAPHAVLTVDLPGNGARWREVSPLSVSAMVDAVRADLAARGQRPPWRVVGLSLGAMVGVAWAHAHPREVESLVLVNTSLRPFHALHERLSPRAWPTLARLAWPGTSAAATERAVLALTSRGLDEATRARVLADWLALRARHPVSRANALRQLWAAARYRAPREKPSVPVLVVGSGGDRLVSPRCSPTLARHWRCELLQHPDAGHDLPLDEPGWLARGVARWQGRVVG